MNFVETPYFHVAHARDLKGRDRVLFRALEFFPGVLSWGTIILIVTLSIYAPVAAAYFIIAFDLYWLLKTFYLSLHQRHNWKRLRHNMSVDWQAMLETLKYEHVHHLVILPFYKESRETVDAALRGLAESHYDRSRLLVVLAAEERAGTEAEAIATAMEEKYRAVFGSVLVSIHPDGLPGEIKGKGPNITYAAIQARDKIIRARHIPYKHVIVSAFDIDTVVEPNYLNCLTWHFLTTEDRHNASYQPVPLYNNNIWDVPAISRVAAFSSTLWQMIQQERAEKLTSFSSHAISFKALERVGFWQKNMVSDDSRIFWNLFLANNGNYRTVPISYPVSMDATFAPSTLQTLVNVYRQQFRWLWGVENLPYMMFGFIKNKAIPLKQRVYHTLVQVEGWWSLATHPLIILLLGWLPLILGGEAFRDTVLSYNLPYITRNLMIVAMSGLVLAAMIAFSFMPKLPEGDGDRKRPRWLRPLHGLLFAALVAPYVLLLPVAPDAVTAFIDTYLEVFVTISLVLLFVLIVLSCMSNRQLKYIGASAQWLLVPFSIVLFGAIPGLHAQTRLMLGAYVGQFWVTPKHRKEHTI